MNIGSLLPKPPARGGGNNQGGDSSTSSAVDAPGRDSGLMSQLGSNPLFTGVPLTQFAPALAGEQRGA